MTSFFGYLEESERELQRVRRLAEADRGLRLDAERKLADLEPEGIDPRSVFLSYSFDDSSEKLARRFRELMTGHGMKVRDGHVEGMGSLSGHILKCIKESAVFVGILTPRADGARATDGTSGWVMEEKGAAVALGKAVLLLGDESIAEDAFRRLSGDSVWISSDGSDKGWSTAFDQALAAMRRTMEQRAAASED
jgi:hypothetical protein